MKKFGFTLAELMISLGIIGIITGAAIYTFKPFDKGIKYMYSNVYYNLEKALYNVVAVYAPENFSDRWMFDKSFKGPDGGRVTVSETNGAVRLCNALIQYINTVQSSCQAGNVISSLDPNDTVFRTNGSKSVTPMFTSTNGVRFWISKRYDDGLNANGMKPSFFVIFADLNGESLPNSMEYEVGDGTKKTKDPDVFAFAALPTGKLCPIGVPEFDERYLSARIKYPGDDSNAMFSTEPESLVSAKARAWGYYVTGSENDDEFILPDSPLSYSDYIFKCITDGKMSDPSYKGSNIYKFMNRMTMRQYFNSKYPQGERPALNSESVDNGGFGCIEKSDSTCEVITDSYYF